MNEEEILELKLEKVDEIIDSFSENDAFNAWNSYCYENDIDSSVYYNNGDFWDIYFNKPSDVIEALYYGSVEYRDKYIYFDSYGNVESFNDIYEVVEFDDDFKEWYINEYNIEVDIEEENLSSFKKEPDEFNFKLTNPWD